MELLPSPLAERPMEHMTKYLQKLRMGDCENENSAGYSKEIDQNLVEYIPTGAFLLFPTGAV